MEEILKIKVDFDGETTKTLLNFIKDTQEGRFTEKKPDLNHVIYKRLQIQEYDSFDSINEIHEEALLFGVSY